MATLYEQTMALQAELDILPATTENCNLFAKPVINILNGLWNPDKKLYAHSASGYYISEEIGDSSTIPAEEFGEVLLHGVVPRMEYVVVRDQMVITLPFVKAVVLGPREQTTPQEAFRELDMSTPRLPLDTILPCPLHLPVKDLFTIEQIVAA